MITCVTERAGGGQGHVFDGKSYVTCDICKAEQIPKQLKVPVKSKPAKPASPLPPHVPILSLSQYCPLNMSRNQEADVLPPRRDTPGGQARDRAGHRL